MSNNVNVGLLSMGSVMIVVVIAASAGLAMLYNPESNLPRNDLYNRNDPFNLNNPNPPQGGSKKNKNHKNKSYKNQKNIYKN
jgi:hypothetical protein